jgi:signal transduction histidine kinase
MIIVVLTVFEISLTLWSMSEISKGAKFHQLNSLHLKYSSEFFVAVSELNDADQVDTELLRELIINVRNQPTECLARVNLLNKFIMRQIGTLHAVDLCEKDIRDANQALSLLTQFEQEQLSKSALISELKFSAQTFKLNSTLFEKPITDTVAFVMRTMIPLVITISVFNIIFITFMSRNISNSIKGTIAMLESDSPAERLEMNIQEKVSGELKTLLEVAKKRLTQELLMTEVNSKLESLVEQRTLSLTRANDELAQFAYRASHDLKGPLSSTKRLCEFILQDIQAGDLENASSDVAKIQNQMKKLEDLVMSILALSNTECDDKLTQIDWLSILNDIRDRSPEINENKDVQFEQTINASTDTVGHRIRITQILENLISNAVKYRDPAEAKSIVKINISEQANTFTLVVEDNGLGIPVVHTDEMFHMFKRFHPRVSSGSGLGLAIVKKHVDCLKGVILVNHLDKGTMFTVTLPKGSISETS